MEARLVLEFLMLPPGRRLYPHFITILHLVESVINEVKQKADLPFILVIGAAFYLYFLEMIILILKKKQTRSVIILVGTVGNPF